MRMGLAFSCARPGLYLTFFALIAKNLYDGNKRYLQHPIQQRYHMILVDVE